MWRVLTQLPSLLTELIAVLREQNLLSRELIRALTRQDSAVPLAPRPRISPPPPRRKLTETDVHRRTPADYATDRRRQQERQIAPHRAISTTALEAASALLNSTHQPNPLVPEILDPSGKSGQVDRGALQDP